MGAPANQIISVSETASAGLWEADDTQLLPSGCVVTGIICVNLAGTASDFTLYRCLPNGAKETLSFFGVTGVASGAKSEWSDCPEGGVDCPHGIYAEVSQANAVMRIFYRA